jgi:hypothetical protein
MLFEKQPTSTDPPEKTPETAMLIYDDLKDHNGSVSDVFADPDTNYPMAWVKWVYNEAKRLEAEIFAYVYANPDCTSGEVVASLSSPYLTVATVGLDVIHYNPTFDEARTFPQFKAAILP